MDCARGTARGLGHALGGAAGGRAQFYLPALFHKAYEAAYGGGFARAGAAGYDRDAVKGCGKHRLALFGAQRHPGIGLISVYHFFGAHGIQPGFDLCRQQALYPERGFPFRLVQAGQVRAFFAGYFLYYDAPIHYQFRQGVAHGAFIRAQYVHGPAHQLAAGQIHMALAAHGLVEHIADARKQTHAGFPGEAQGKGDLIRRAEAHALHLVGQAIGILAHHGLGHVAELGAYAAGQPRGHAQGLQEHHGVAHAHVLSKGFPYQAGALGADAGYLRKALGMGLHYIQGGFSEMLHDEPGGGRAHALDQARRQVFFYVGNLFGQQGFIGRYLYLLAVFPVLHQFAFKGGALPRRQKWHYAHGSQLPRAIRLYRGHGKAVLIVSEYYLLYGRFKSCHMPYPECRR